MARRRRVVIALVAIARHVRGAGKGRQVPGGVLIGDAGIYDALSHQFMLGSLFRGIAADIAAGAPDGARVLEVGCGPGRLSIRLARHYGLDVTGLDLDPAMIERARANAERPGEGDERRPLFLVGDVASLAFPDGSFDRSSARCPCTTGPARERLWSRSAVYCARAPGRSSGTSGPASYRSTRMCPIRSSTHMASLFGWQAPRHGAGPGDFASPADRAGPR